MDNGLVDYGWMMVNKQDDDGINSGYYWGHIGVTVFFFPGSTIVTDG